MIRFYFNTGPNPKKVALFLEEAGLPYEVVAVDSRKGDQHTPEFRRINPNGKAPAIEDDGEIVFDSNAILLYLAEKHGVFLPKGAGTRGTMLSWLMFVATGLSPFMGQAVHFGNFAPAGNDYGVNRYRFEAARHWTILDERLADRQWILGDDYTIVDMAAWGWSGALPFALGDEGAFDRFPNVHRWREAINARPAAQRAGNVGADLDFKTEMDEDAKRHMFPSNYAGERVA